MAPFQILVVEDDEGDRKLLRRLIARALPEATLREASDLSALCDETADLAAPTAAGTDPRASVPAAADPAGTVIADAGTGAGVEDWGRAGAPVGECRGDGGGSPDLILLDHLLPGRPGLDLIGALARRWPRAAIVLMTGQGSEELATAAIQNGAVDYIAKRALTAEALERIARRGVETARLRWRIEEQRRELEMFCEVLVHDFRAPIRAVGFLAESLLEDLATADRAAMETSAALLLKSARQMSDLVQSLSTHIRLDRDGAEFRQVPLASVAEAALTALHREVIESAAAIEIDTGGIAVTCDPPALAQVLQNLVANAIKYCGERPPRIRISARRGPEGVQLRVDDAGVGVPEAQAERIFAPFVRLTGTGKKPGTGLGLATCRKLVQRHGGTIHCHSREGGGTSFRICLPASPGSGAEKGAAAASGGEAVIAPTDRRTVPGAEALDVL